MVYNRLISIASFAFFETFAILQELVCGSSVGWACWELSSALNPWLVVLLPKIWLAPSIFLGASERYSTSEALRKSTHAGSDFPNRASLAPLRFYQDQRPSLGLGILNSRKKIQLCRARF